MNLAALKAIPYIGFAMYAFVKARENSSKNKGQNQIRPEILGILTGTVSKSLKDDDKYLTLVQSGKESLWLVTEAEMPPKGGRISFVLGKRYDAYESRPLQMAFETVYKLKSLELLDVQEVAQV